MLFAVRKDDRPTEALNTFTFPNDRFVCALLSINIDIIDVARLTHLDC